MKLTNIHQPKDELTFADLRDGELFTGATPAYKDWLFIKINGRGYIIKNNYGFNKSGEDGFFTDSHPVLRVKELTAVF